MNIVAELAKNPNHLLFDTSRNIPGAILEIDGMHWQHPVTGCHARCQFMVDIGSRAPMVTVFEETRERSTRNNQTKECKESLLKDWFVHRKRPRLIRTYPDGCYMSNEDARHVASRSWDQHRGHTWRSTVETVDHGCHHETGETNSAHLRGGSGTCRFLSRGVLCKL